jgi:hypothetical protein
MYFENAIAPCGTCGVSCLMRTFTDRITPSYPVGVFNVEGEYLGIAESPYEYITLWNDDPANQLRGTLKQGSYDFEFKFVANPGEEPLYSVTGLRFWQVDVTNWCNLVCNPTDYILVDDMINQANSSPYNFSTATYYGIGASYSMTKSAIGETVNYNAKIYSFNVGAIEKTVTIFHNDTDLHAGIVGLSSGYIDGGSGGLNGLGPGHRPTSMKNIRGKFPLNTEQLVFITNGMVNDNINVNNLNISELTNVVFLFLAEANYNEVSQVTADGDFSSILYNLPNKGRLAGIHVDHSAIIGQNVFGIDDSGIGQGLFPNLKVILFRFRSKPFNPNALLFPKVNRLFNIMYGNAFGGQNYSTQEIDDIYNMLAVALDNVIPLLGGRLDVQWWNTNASENSASSRAYLQGQGWIVN